MSGWREVLDDEERGALEDAAHPDWLAPMLATLTDERFSDPDWIFERKLDGERMLAFRRGDDVRLLTRNRKCANETYPEIVEALAGQACEDFVVDGEIVAFDGDETSFSRLQDRMKITDAEEARASDVAVYFYLFDVLHADGCRLDGLALRARKKVLRELFDWNRRLRFTEHRNEEGEAFHAEACEKGWEGIIAKRADSRYRHDRSRDWLKFKCDEGQELVIGGFTEPEGERIGFGALLVGVHEDGELRYAGKVGTGYDDEFLEEFRARLDEIEIDECPFAEEPSEASAHWVEPEYVGEFGFTEWTDDGKLRHPRFLGLRRDKDPEDVVREQGEDDR
ncbi:MAG: non-homologous end-joining DNA ligase [Wenzhouxiangellaceae bacterium]|nr:non-homologous end-joining DNA ligase [Wenzhouxiangellaceae bacterium]